MQRTLAKSDVPVDRLPHLLPDTENSSAVLRSVMTSAVQTTPFVPSGSWMDKAVGGLVMALKSAERGMCHPSGQIPCTPAPPGMKFMATFQSYNIPKDSQDGVAESVVPSGQAHEPPAWGPLTSRLLIIHHVLPNFLMG